MRLVPLYAQLQKRVLPPALRNTQARSHLFAHTLTNMRSGTEHTPQASAQYVVKPGDTLSGIATTLKKRERTSESVATLVSRIAKTNHLSNPDALAVGQRLTLPPDLAARVPTEYARSSSSRTSARKAAATVRTFGNMITAISRQLRLDPALSLAVARAESGVSAAGVTDVVLNPRAVSPDGKSVGLFQLTSATGKEQLKKLNARQAYNPLNPRQNTQLGVGYLKHLSEVFAQETVLQQDLQTTPGANPRETRRLAIAAYNAGMGRVAKAQAQARAHGANPALYQAVTPYLPAITQQYVERVERFAKEFSKPQLSGS